MGNMISGTFLTVDEGLNMDFEITTGGLINSISSGSSGGDNTSDTIVWDNTSVWETSDGIMPPVDIENIDIEDEFPDFFEFKENDFITLIDKMEPKVPEKRKEIPKPKRRKIDL